jgi:membrane-associated phospholipid phosphatase
MIALAVSLVTGLVLGIFPELDLKAAALFYDPATRSFPLSASHVASVLRYSAMVIAWGFAAPAIAALIIKLIWPNKPLMMPGRKMLFIVVTITLSAGILSNYGFKGHWGRPRPVAVTEFNGPLNFVPWWDPHGACPKNCSFFSGEGATAFWTIAPATLAPPQWRPLAYGAAVLFGVATSGLRMAFGGHFLSDVVAAALVTFLVIWLCHAYIFRWPGTRMSDEAIDAALTRIGWPGYAWRQRVFRDRNPHKPSFVHRIVEAHHDD